MFLIGLFINYVKVESDVSLKENSHERLRTDTDIIEKVDYLERRALILTSIKQLWATSDKSSQLDEECTMVRSPGNNKINLPFYFRILTLSFYLLQKISNLQTVLPILFY